MIDIVNFFFVFFIYKIARADNRWMPNYSTISIFCAECLKLHMHGGWVRNEQKVVFQIQIQIRFAKDGSKFKFDYDKEQTAQAWQWAGSSPS